MRDNFIILSQRTSTSTFVREAYFKVKIGITFVAQIQEDESDEDRSDSKDEDFEIEDDSVGNIAFEQHELIDLARDLTL
ncbi:hypothetical protein TNCV_3525971 [Trichonephila clavipes]|nr:hypothetical protein TNCV_3525971 [Trichonephila clavipes]